MDKLMNLSFILNPYKVCPLSGIVTFEIEEACDIEINVEGIVGNYTLVPGQHELPVLGLKPNCQNQIRIKCCYQSGREECVTLEAKTEALPIGFPKIHLEVSQPNKQAQGLYALSLGRSEGVKTVEPLYTMIDSKGQVRWLYTEMTCHVFKRLKNGNLIVDAPMSSGICGAYTSAGFIEMDLVGKVVAFYALPYGLHHDVTELPNGNFLAITQREETKQDLVVEIDRNSREIIHEWDFRKILDPTRQTVIDKVSVNHPLDWLHLNAVFYDEIEDCMIATSRNQSCIIKFHKQTQEIKWIIAPDVGWNEHLRKYLLKSENEQDLCWAPHTPSQLSNGDITVFDNGNFRSYDLENAKYAYENFSRGMIYTINEKARTFKAVWSYGEDRGNALYCPYLGSMTVLSNNNRLICFGGITRDIFGGPTDDMKSNRMKNQVVIVEVTPDEQAEVVFEVRIQDKDITTAGGYKCYRCEKITLY